MMKIPLIFMLGVCPLIPHGMDAAEVGIDGARKIEASGEAFVLKPYAVFGAQLDLGYDNPHAISVLTVTTVAHGSDAERAGLQRGMRIVKINGIAVSGLSKDELAIRINDDLKARGQLTCWTFTVSRLFRRPKDIEVPWRTVAPPRASGAEPAGQPSDH